MTKDRILTTTSRLKHVVSCNCFAYSAASSCHSTATAVTIATRQTQPGKPLHLCHFSGTNRSSRIAIFVISAHRSRRSACQFGGKLTQTRILWHKPLHLKSDVIRRVISRLQLHKRSPPLLCLKQQTVLALVVG
jgi:hypothetical protein